MNNLGELFDRKLKTMKGKKVSFKLNLLIPAVIILAIGLIFGINGWIIAGLIVLLSPYLLLILSFMFLVIADFLAITEPYNK